VSVTWPAGTYTPPAVVPLLTGGTPAVVPLDPEVLLLELELKLELLLAMPLKPLELDQLAPDAPLPPDAPADGGTANAVITPGTPRMPARGLPVTWLVVTTGWVPAIGWVTMVGVAVLPPATGSDWLTMLGWWKVLLWTGAPPMTNAPGKDMPNTAGAIRSSRASTRRREPAPGRFSLRCLRRKGNSLSRKARQTRQPLMGIKGMITSGELHSPCKAKGEWIFGPM